MWYELGIRHALRKGTIMMIESGQQLPFDISSYGALIYEDSLGGVSGFEAALTEFIDRIERDHPVDSPAQEFLGPYLEEQIERQRREQEAAYQLRLEQAFQATSARRAAAPPPAAAEPQVARAPRILWVDDHPGNNQVLIETYQARGVAFDLAMSTDQALEYLGGDSPYVLVISDMGRGADRDAGIQLLSALQQRRATVPPFLIYTSRSAAKAYGARAKELGAVDVTSSPKDVSLWIEQAIASARAAATGR